MGTTALSYCLSPVYTSETMVGCNTQGRFLFRLHSPPQEGVVRITTLIPDQFSRCGNRDQTILTNPRVIVYALAFAVETLNPSLQ